MSKLSLGLGSCISCLDFGSYIASYTCSIFTALGKLDKLVEQKLEVHVDLFTAHDSFVQAGNCRIGFRHLGLGHTMPIGSGL